MESPRFCGVRTFARCPYVTDLEGVDVALVGVPFDTAVSFRPGTRFGPEAIRSVSPLIRAWHPALKVDVFANQSVVDFGDISITPGNAEQTTQQIADGVGALRAAGVTPIVLGGDHSIVLGELRGHAAQHGPLSLVLLDAHADCWNDYFGERYFHGTPFLRAVEEGLIDPSRSIMAGMRGPVYSADDFAFVERLGFEVISGEELRTLTPAQYRERVERRVDPTNTYMSFDIDVIDPAFAPGTGTPEVAGLLPHEAIAFLRSLAGMSFVGFDIVEVSPTYDTFSQITAILAANIAFEMLALRAISTTSRG
jgi:agmatinase